MAIERQSNHLRASGTYALLTALCATHKARARMRVLCHPCPTCSGSAGALLTGRPAASP